MKKKKGSIQNLNAAFLKQKWWESCSYFVKPFSPQALQQNQGKLEPACWLQPKYQTKILFILKTEREKNPAHFSVFLCPPWSTRQDRTQCRVLPQVTPSLLYALWCYNNEFVFPLLPCLTVTCSLLKQSAFYSSVPAVQTEKEHGRAPAALGPGAPSSPGLLRVSSPEKQLPKIPHCSQPAPSPLLSGITAMPAFPCLMESARNIQGTKDAPRGRGSDGFEPAATSAAP